MAGIYSELRTGLARGVGVSMGVSLRPDTRYECESESCIKDMIILEHDHASIA